MGKTTAHPSLKGKKPINTSSAVRKSARPMTQNPSFIANKLKRSELYGRYLLHKKSLKREQRLKREREAEELGEDAPPKQTPKTLDNTRVPNSTTVQLDDEEVMGDEAQDEFASYFADTKRPKICLTTRPRPSSQLFFFIHDLMTLIPQTFYYPRKSFSVKDICGFAKKKDFTHLMVLSEKSKVCNGMLISHLSGDDGGPTAFFKVTNVVSSTAVPNHGVATDHIPELVLNGFGTRLGHRVGRLLGSLFPHDAQFVGRQVVTFHNQRDYIFVRHHRYVFEENNTTTTHKSKEEQKKAARARLQELGPRFSLKLRWIQEGTFDTKFGEYEWFHKRKEMDVTRRTFHL